VILQHAEHWVMGYLEYDIQSLKTHRLTGHSYVAVSREAYGLDPWLVYTVAVAVISVHCH